MARHWYREHYEYFPDYDEEPYVQNTQEEVDFIERALGREGRSPSSSARLASPWMLDVGCGTGRHTLELARRGYEVVGLDLSAAMVRQGRSTACDEGLSVPFLVGDARALSLRRAFDAALILCEGGFSLMETDAMDRLILREAARALRPGGTLMMTAPHAAFVLAHEPQEGTFDAVTLRETFELETEYQTGQRKVLQGTQRYYTCPELRWLLNDVGFHSVQFFAVSEQGFSREVSPSSDHFEVGAIARRR